MSKQSCSEKIKKLPLEPGVYIMKDKAGTIIYIGKAKKLKNRVSSYFVGTHLPKVQKMADQIDDFDYIVVPTEREALILENNLIKLHRPKYNILLKDDKSYPYLALDKRETYPRLMLCRKRQKDGKIYFGPFSSGSTVRQIKRQTEQLFGLVTCVPKIGTRPCLSYQMGLCSGVCTGKIDAAEYDARVRAALSFLRGDYKKTLRELQTEMEQAAEVLAFERAAALRDRIASIRRLGEVQTMVLSPDVDADIFGMNMLEEKQCLSVITVRDGRLCRQDRFFLGENGETDELGAFLQQYYDEDIPPRIVCEHAPETALQAFLSEKRGAKVEFVCPKRGAMKALLDMARKNALEGLEMRRSLKDKAHRTAVSLAEFLGLTEPPRRIEMYDISNFGTDAMVGGMIVWENGALKKSQYRRFAVQNPGIDDYAATREVLSRRLADYQAGKKGFETPPDIILTDGGRGHISAVADLIEKALPDCKLYGLVKDARHRTHALVLPDGSQLGLAASPRWFSFFTMLQDEVHRYAITTMHRKKSREMTRSELLKIPGVGQKRLDILFAHFKTMAAIRAADREALAAVPGLPENAAAAIFEYFHGGEQA